MNILVYDVAASESGALSILEEYYERFAKEKKGNKYFFVISTPTLKNTSDITILKYPWIKKNWFNRLFFDYFIAPQIVKKYNIQEVLSLQNMLIPNIKIPQILYLHQPLPFIKKRFSFIENNIFWIYQNIIGRMIKQSIKKAKYIIVQTQWMRQACIEQCNIDFDKIILKQPQIELENIVRYKDAKENRRLFFYPATPLSYKNHITILKACKLLKDEGYTNYRVILTFCGNENKYAKQLYDYSLKYNLPIEFKGKLRREEVFEMYSHSILLFPSYIETFGLPLLEARLSGAPIIAADTEFAREILDEYEKGAFFQTLDCKELKDLMKAHA